MYIYILQCFSANALKVECFSNMHVTCGIYIFHENVAISVSCQNYQVCGMRTCEKNVPAYQNYCSVIGSIRNVNNFFNKVTAVMS